MRCKARVSEVSGLDPDATESGDREGKSSAP
ncbi:hypothetical protein BamMEX5DRAFT_0538 [Burkholderia ambifaria MEX-5]|uniref:Uncharacterized protein n=1 Tax=Burkholderia ambifaria MEX-5 TaxID=396597 RepID=B1SYC2_9BURK|nr:hypothetical protein BamMEX5DRAFT_0538 [Burkholderia ambifaria MEX-5]